MPYRKLPNTDAGRQQAMQAASNKAAVVDPASLAFSAETKTMLEALQPLFITEMSERGQALAT